MDDGKSSHSKRPNPIYVLASNDGPGTIITHVVLKGSNYEEWAKGFRVSSGAKRKLGFIDGTLDKPQDSFDLDDWWTINYMIVAWIFNTIDPSVRSTISYRDTAKELWEDIQQSFSVGNGVKIYQLKSDIANCNQNNEESIMNYYGRLKKLWDEVNDYDALPSCSCNGCKCELNATLRKRRETGQIREFLMGLEPYYANIRSSILGIEPLPSLHAVYSRLVQEEEVRLLTKRKTEAVAPMAFAVQRNAVHNSKTGRSARSPLKCTYCGRLGHHEDRCWEKHGYPKDQKRMDPGVGRGKEASSHYNQMAKANVVVGEVSATTNHVRLNGKGITTWIIDTGASIHICCDETLFDYCCSIHPIAVGLPNGTNLEAVKVGSVKLNNDLDHASRKKIGVGKLVDGLYWMTMGEPTLANVVAGTETLELWHKRLGHPSLQTMEHFSHIHVCDVNDVVYSDNIDNTEQQHEAPSTNLNDISPTPHQHSLDDTEGDEYFNEVVIGMGDPINLGSAEIEGNTMSGGGDMNMSGDDEYGRGKREKFTNTRFLQSFTHTGPSLSCLIAQS
ncbi:unnamed protein product [Amaranthus hypochondriacus]